MSERPDLNINMDEQTFRSYYYLKEELADFCRKNGLQGHNRYERADLVAID